MKTIIISITAITAAIIFTTALTVGVAVAKDKNPEKVVERVTEKLSLDSNQQAILYVLIDEKKKLRIELKEQRQAKKAEFKAAKESGEPINKGLLSVLSEKDQISVADINQIINDKQAKRQERQQPVLQAFVDFRNSLSVEQREQAKPIFRRLLRGVMGGHGKKKHSRHG